MRAFDRLTRSRRSCRSRKPADAGLTLVEMLVVLVLTALLMTALPPVMAATIPAFRLRAAADELAADLRSARSTAVGRGEEIVVRFMPEEGTYETAGRQHRLPSSVRFDFEPGPWDKDALPVAVIRFFPEGGTSGGAVRLSAGHRSIRVAAGWLAGRIEVEEPR